MDGWLRVLLQTSLPSFVGIGTLFVYFILLTQAWSVFDGISDTVVQTVHGNCGSDTRPPSRIKVSLSPEHQQLLGGNLGSRQSFGRKSYRINSKQSIPSPPIESGTAAFDEDP